MIGMLNGEIILKSTTFFILSVHDVGYKVLVPSSVLSTKQKGEKVQLFTHTHVREDLLELYGFLDSEDLMLFEMLIGVSGVGCKSALGIFAIGDRKNILQAITTGDVAFFQQAPRLGKKNAQKVIIELKSKVNNIDSEKFNLDLSTGSDEVLEALKGFGFSAKEALIALRHESVRGETTAEKVKAALKYLGK